MKLATAPVNWNSPDVPEYRTYTPYPQLLEEMAAAGYSGWLVVEQDTTPDNPTTIAKENRLYLEALLKSEAQSGENG
jgi:sugar phosphate isomerase/epimerase